MRYFTLVGLFVVLVCTAAAAAADKNYTDIKLVVTDGEKGTPIPRAAVTLKFAKPKKFRKDEKFEWDLKTDSRGQANVPFIPNGKVRVLVFAKGYQTFGEDIDVAGAEQTINVKLSRPGTQFSAHDTPEERKAKETPKKP